MNNLEKSEKLSTLRKAIDKTVDQKEKIKLIQETAKILQEVNAEKTIHLDQAIKLGEQEILYTEKEMKRIQAKKNITVKEFTEIYNISKTSQQNYRSRLYDPLPYHQKVEGGNITYAVEEVEKWFENQHK